MREFTFFVSHYHIPQFVLISFMVVYSLKWPPDETVIGGVPFYKHFPKAAIRTGHGKKQLQVLGTAVAHRTPGDNICCQCYDCSCGSYLVSHNADPK